MSNRWEVKKKKKKGRSISQEKKTHKTLNVAFYFLDFEALLLILHTR
jgi:hypothetical protein